MSDDLKVDLCVIGAGPGGLSVAAVASQMGASTALIEKDKMGGDCLNTGCVPSKALLAAAHAAEAARRGGRFGVDVSDPAIDSSRVYGHVHGVIAHIAPNDSVERFEGLGVKVIQGAARFTGRRQVEAGDFRVTARSFVIATGSSPFIPPIQDLDGVPFHTNETIFDLKVLPRRLIIIGGGPIGIEMAQAHRNLGAGVTVLEMFSIMPKDDPELVEILRNLLKAEGVDIREGVKISRVEKTPHDTPGGGVAVILGDETRIEGSHLLVAAGRRANVNGLGLEKAGVASSPMGIEVDARMRTANKKIFAIGGVTGGYQFTHMAAYHAGIVIRNALFKLPAKADHSAVPWVTYTSPELAHVGLNEEQAKKRHGGVRGAVRVLRWPFAENDRAVAEGKTDGLVKAVVTPKGRILGASILGANAGDLIQTWTLAISAKLKISAVASMISPYPTLGEANKRAAGSFYKEKLLSEGTRKLVRFLSRFG
ncbi:MAG TPA: dihydrolipoamide dehydrogenase [Rhodospirillales bacterium]|nr:dihydrolipoamide dehydrogenase [Rhodospirillales bacterium]